MNKQKMTPFEQALLDAALEEFSDIPDKDAEIEVTFSPAFVAKSERLLQHTRQKSWWHVNAAMKRAALVAAIAALLVSTAMAIPAVREEVIRFFIREQGTHIAVAFDPKQAAMRRNVLRRCMCPPMFRKDTRRTPARLPHPQSVPPGATSTETPLLIINCPFPTNPATASFTESAPMVPERGYCI